MTDVTEDAVDAARHEALLSENTRNMLSGGLAGVVGKTCTAPLSRMTILYQLTPLLATTKVQGVVKGTHIHGGENQSILEQLSSLGKEFRRVIKQEGFLSFWKGNGTSVIHRFPYSAINFSQYEFSKSTLTKEFGWEEGPATRLVCGAYAGGAACMATYPLDLIRTRLTIQVDTPELAKAVPQPRPLQRSSKILTIMSNIVAKEGIFGLYRGLFVSLAVSVPNLAIAFSAYGTVKEYFLYREPSGLFRDSASENLRLNPLGSMFSGALSGITSSLIIFPMDVVRRRMQVVGILEDTADAAANGKSIKKAQPRALTMLREIVQKEGLKGVYRGLLPEILKVTPMVGVTFCVYEFVNSHLNKL